MNIQRRTCSASVDGYTKTSSWTQTAKTLKTETTLYSGKNAEQKCSCLYQIISFCSFTHVWSSTLRYRKGFELQPTLYSGINLAVLLIVAGLQFESSIELRKIGERLQALFTEHVQIKPCTISDTLLLKSPCFLHLLLSVSFFVQFQNC